MNKITNRRVSLFRLYWMMQRQHLELPKLLRSFQLFPKRKLCPSPRLRWPVSSIQRQPLRTCFLPMQVHLIGCWKRCSLWFFINQSRHQSASLPTRRVIFRWWTFDYGDDDAFPHGECSCGTFQFVELLVTFFLKSFWDDNYYLSNKFLDLYCLNIIKVRLRLSIPFKFEKMLS